MIDVCLFLFIQALGSFPETSFFFKTIEDRSSFSLVNDGPPTLETISDEDVLEDDRDFRDSVGDHFTLIDFGSINKL